MFIFEQRQEIDKELYEIFPFFEKPENLGEITPTWINFKINGNKKMKMQENAEFNYTIKMYGIPIRWKTLITKYEPPYLFVDVQKKGPYKKWIHHHHFEEKGGKTIMIDKVEYDLYGGPIKKLINKLFIERSVKKIFQFRKEVIKKKFGNN